jgi:glycosyltransferase involved in cell wall biosynthesis
LLCLYQHAPTPGAPGIYRHRLYFAELVRRGWNVDLVSTAVNYMTGTVPPAYARRGYVHETIDGIDHHWVRASGRIHDSIKRRALNYATFAASAGARSVRLPTPDVILISSPPISVGALGPLLATRFRRPWLLEVRDAWPESAAAVGWLEEGTSLYRFFDWIARRLASSASSVVVPAAGLVDIVRGHGARQVDVVPGAVFGQPQEEANEARERVRAELGISPETCLFIYVGALGVANGLDILLESVQRLPADIPAQFLLVGDGSARAGLEARVANERIERVTISHAVPKERVAALLAASDVCLHLLRPDPIFYSATPNKVLEYFGARRPFITNVPGSPERFAVESGGAFAPSVEALTHELEAWSALTPTQRRERGEQSFRYGSERFSLAAAVDVLEDALLRACKLDLPARESPQVPVPDTRAGTAER